MTISYIGILWIAVSAAAAPKPAPVTEYAIHADGGIIYDPLRREAEKTGQLAKYKDVDISKHELNLGPYHLRLNVPKKAEAYDVVPIAYELSWKGETKPSFPTAIEATAFEDEQRRKGRDLFDLALPGKIDMDFEYLGSVTANLKPNGRHNLKPDYSDEPGEYPPFICKPLVHSGVVEAGDLVWFRIKYTNTGTTILDPEGMGGYLLYPHLFRKNDKGEYDLIGLPHNLYIRDLGYLYPGESRETWVSFTVHGETPEGKGLIPGEYRLQMQLIYRYYKNMDVFLNIWEGGRALEWEMPFTVEKQPREAPCDPGKKTLTDAHEPDKITRFIHTFEEFMTAFDCLQLAPDSKGEIKKLPTPPSPPLARGGVVIGALHLQVAPWTKNIVIKLISTDPIAIVTAAVPIEISTDSLTIKPNLSPAAFVRRNHHREPIFTSQTMADMRANIQLGPYPEKHIRERLREMLDCGVNVVSLTNMPWLYDDRRKPRANYNGDAMKYVLDLARAEGMVIEGWGTYPFDQAVIPEIAAWITGKPQKLDIYTSSAYHAVSQTDPQLPAANAAVWLYQFHRWGDLYLQPEDGNVPISVEDTVGWMRQDNNIRHAMGDRSLQAFRDWIKSKYGTIEAANTAWNTSFQTFDEINPEKNQVTNQFGHRWEYTDPSQPFHDWNQSVEDFDTFRTELRVKNYREALKLVRGEIPNAVISLRTEGANILAGGIDPRDPNSHLRHVYYSQRRGALIAEIIQQSGAVKYHTDYTTMPYTPSELRQLIPAALSQGIMPAYLPEFDNMRDIAINAKYGSDYQIHYNLPEPRKGYMMHVLTAAYPWWRATVEAGGIPGILWEDYQCDGFATETQKRELKLFTEQLKHDLPVDTPEAGNHEKDEEWRKNSRAKVSYRIMKDK